MRTALITGAAGFVGSRLAAHLAAAGWAVHGLELPGADDARVRRLAPGARLHAFDGDTGSLCALVARLRPDACFHLAALFLARHRPEDVEPLVGTNVLLSAQVGEALAQAGVPRLVTAATSWQHFEGAAYAPVALYAATKQAAEDLLAYHAGAAGLRVAALRLFDTYGPGDVRVKIFNVLRDAARAGAGPVRMSAGAQLVDLVHVDDVARAFVRAEELLRGEPAGAVRRWAVSSGRPTTLRELAALFETAAGHRLPLEWGALPYRPREMFRPWDAGPVVPGWRPEVPLEQGVADALREDAGVGAR